MKKHSLAVAVGALLILLPAVSIPGPASSAQKKKPTQTYGVIAGSVFQESGRSLRGAKVTVTQKPEDASPSRRARASKAVSDSRGEFAVRVPSGAMSYTVKVEARGFQSQEKVVTIQWEERLDLYFLLKAERQEGGASK